MVARTALPPNSFLVGLNPWSETDVPSYVKLKGLTVNRKIVPDLDPDDVTPGHD